MRRNTAFAGPKLGGKVTSRSRSRSRSRSKSPQGKRPKGHQAKGPPRKSVEHKDIPLARKMAFAVASHSLYPVVKRLAAPKDQKDAGWVDLKESKSDPTIDLLLSQLQTARGMIRNALGLKPFKVVLTADASGLFLATVTSGVCNAVFNLIPSNSAEFSSLATIFDEVKMSSAEMAFQLACSTSTVAVDASRMLAVCYDPMDTTALTSTLNGTQFAQHRLYSVPATNTYQNVYPHAEPNKFRCHMPPGQAISGASIEGSWTATSSVGSYGYFKVYMVQTTVTAVNVASAIVYEHCEFRCRA